MSLHPDSAAVRAGLHRSGFDETAEALYLTSGYVYATAAEAEAAFAGDIDRYVYSRYGNPTVTMLEERLAAIEGAEACIATSSGMAAVFHALACQLASGDRVVASRALFGSCIIILDEILARWGVRTDWVDPTSIDEWAAALASPADVVFLETPSNPMLDLVDLPAVAQLAHDAGARVVVDNVLATPVLQRSFELGADVVVYSTTKHLDGHGRTIGGAVLAGREFVEAELRPMTRHTGPSMSPFTAWTVLKSVETLTMRVERQSATAAALADAVAEHSCVTGVWYPFRDDHPQAGLARRQMISGGSIVTFEVRGGKAGAFATLDALRMVDISNNLGDAKTLATHPASTTHRRIGPERREVLGITDGVVRISVGLEHPGDVLGDVLQALDAAADA